MKTPSIALGLVLSVVACKQRNETTAPPAPTPVTTTAPPVAPPPAMPVAVVDAGAVMPGPNAMATPDAGAATGLAPGAAPPTGAPPAAPAAPPVVATADAGTAPAAPATAAAAPSTTRPSTRNGTTTTPINIPGVNGGPPVTVQQGHGQTRVNVGGVQVVIPGVGGN